MIMQITVLRAEMEIHKRDVMQDLLTIQKGFTKQVAFYQGHCSMGF